MKIFVAGATGDVGRRVVRRLVAAGHDVTGIARSKEKAELLTRLGAAPVTAGIFDATALEAPVRGHDVVVNVASHVPSGARALLPGASQENDRIRAEGAPALATAALSAGAARFIQASLTFPYADGGDQWLDERAEWRIPSAFAVVDVAEAAASRVTESGATGVILRFAFFHSPDGAVTRDALRLARRGIALEPGTPDSYFATIHVDDAATAVVAALDVPAGVYNVADDDPLTRGEYLDVLARAVGRRRLRTPGTMIRAAGGARAEVFGRSQRVSNRTLRTMTHWAPAFPSMREAWPAIVAEAHS